MEKISDSISKKVVSLESGNIVGYVLDILFDEELKKLLGFLIVDDESEELYFLPNNKIKSRSQECLVIENDDDPEFYVSSLYNNPIGKNVFDCNGLNLGKVLDVILDGNLVKKIATTKCEFSIGFLRKSGKDCLIFGKKRKKNAKKVLFSSNFDKLPKVSIEKYSIQSDYKNQKNIFEKSFNFVEKPIKAIVSDDLVIGKKVKKNILGYNNELIAKENDKITKKIIEKAKKHGKFNILSIFCE